MIQTTIDTANTQEELSDGIGKEMKRNKKRITPFVIYLINLFTSLYTLNLFFFLFFHFHFLFFHSFNINMISTIGHILHHTHYFYIQLAAVLYKDYGDEDETSRDREEANNKSEKMKAHSVYCILLLFYISIRDRIFQYYNII